MTQGAWNPGRFNKRLDFPLMGRIEIGEKETDCHGFHAGLGEISPQALESIPFKLLEFLTRAGNPSPDTDPELRGYQVGLPLIGEIVQTGPVLTSDFNEVLKPFVGDEGRFGALSFQDGIGGYRGTVGDLSLLPGGDGLQPRQKGLGGVFRR